ncbi:MAG: plasmid recombination protein [Bacteroidales bacterium]|nr:plasmid recombination protein [Bacteroidales bacterium]
MEKESSTSVSHHYRRYSCVFNLETRKASYPFPSCQSEMQRSRDSSTLLNVDRSSSHSNRFILPGGKISTTDRSSLGMRTRIMNRIEEATGSRTVPPGRVIDLGFILSGSKEVFMSMGKEEIESWASDSYNYMARVYGEDNIVGAVLHMDESNPHLHMDIVPIHFMEGRAKLCATDLHKDGRYRTILRGYWEAVGKYGFDPMREHTHAKHYKPWEIHAEWEERLLEDSIRNDLLKQKTIILKKEIESLEKEISRKKEDLLELSGPEDSSRAAFAPEDLPIRKLDFSPTSPTEGIPEGILPEYESLRKEISLLCLNPKKAAASVESVSSRSSALQAEADRILYEGMRESMLSSGRDVLRRLKLSEKRLGEKEETLKDAADILRRLDGCALSSLPEKERRKTLSVLSEASERLGSSPGKMFPELFRDEIFLRKTVPWLEGYSIRRLAEITVPSDREESRLPSSEGIIRLGKKEDIPVNISYLTCGDSPITYRRSLSWETLSEKEKGRILSFIEEKIGHMPRSFIGELRMMEKGIFHVPQQIPYIEGEVDFTVALWSNNLNHFARNGYFDSSSGRVPSDDGSRTKERDIEYMENVSSPEWSKRWERLREEESLSR